MTSFLNKIYIILFLLSFSISGYGALSEDNIYVPRNVEQSISGLSTYLTKNERRDFDKAKNIYKWITQNFIFEEKYKSRSKPLTIHQVLKRKRGSAEDFSTLFDTLCHHAGVTSKQIVGYTFTENKPIIKVLYQPNHYWNAIMIDSNWYQVDCLWGSDFGNVKKLTFDISHNAINYEMNQQENQDDYFCPLPQDFIKTHLPSDPNWQLLSESITSKEFIQNDFSRVGKSELKNIMLDKYSSLEKSDYLYESSKESFEFNSKNHKQLAISSLKKGQMLTMGKDFTQREKTLYYQQKQIYYHQAASSALSYSSNVSLYSKIEKEALNLWIRHNIEVPSSKRLKYIGRYYLNKDEMQKKENNIRKMYHGVKIFEEKISKKHYTTLRKPRRKVERDALYFKVTNRQVGESDSIILSLQIEIAKIKSLNAVLKEKRKEQYLVKKSLNYSQTSYLQQLKLLLDVQVTLQVLGHQSSQISKVDNNIDVLVKSIRSIEKEIYNNNLVLNKNISNLKKEIVAKQNLLRGMYIMSNGEETYKNHYDEVAEELKELFYYQTIVRRENYKGLLWEFEAMKDENEELARQKKIVKEINKIKSTFKKEKISAIVKRELKEKKFCNDINKAVYNNLNEFKRQTI